MPDNQIQEKLFKTEIVASYVEKCYLGGFDYNEIFEFASFITKENINYQNISKYRPIIMNELLKIYPDLRCDIRLLDGEIDTDIYVATMTPFKSRKIYEEFQHILPIKNVKEYKNYYKKLYGDYMLVRSISKKPVKILKFKKN